MIFSPHDNLAAVALGILTLCPIDLLDRLFRYSITKALTSMLPLLHDDLASTSDFLGSDGLIDREGVLRKLLQGLIDYFYEKVLVDPFIL